MAELVGVGGIALGGLLAAAGLVFGQPIAVLIGFLVLAGSVVAGPVLARREAGRRPPLPDPEPPNATVPTDSETRGTPRG